jgi:glycerol-3-phosphate dehydrogenase
MKPFDVCIIGGGVTGTAIARELSQYRLNVALLEKEAELAFGVSKSNSGIVHPGTQNPPDSLKGRLCVQGNLLMRQLARDLGVHFVEVGELIVINTLADLPKLEKIKSEAETLGVPGLQIVDRAWLEKNEPNLSPEIPAALFAPTAGIISPYRLVYDLAENAAKNGVRFFTGHAVQSIRRQDNFFYIQTSQGDFSSRWVINAAGLFADEISRLVGVDDFLITPRLGEEYLLDKKREHLARHLIFPLPTPESKGILIIKTSDGNPMVGPTARPAAAKTDLSTTDEGLQKVFQSVQRLVPCIQERDIIAYFAGLRPAAGDDFIIRHEHRVPGFVNVAGIQSPGLTAAPAVAKHVAGLLQQNGLALKRKWFFHRHRRASVHLFAIPFSQTEKLIQRDPGYGDIVCRCEMVSAQEIREAIRRGARTLDGVKFRTRAQAGRCHGSFCTTRILKIMAAELKLPVTALSKRGPGSELVLGSRDNA